MSIVTEETALSVRQEQSFELAPTAAAAEKQFEIQSAIVIARRFPRNEDHAFEKLMRACKRLSFAEDTAYSFPRGAQKVEGPSVNLAREAARVWGNIRHGVDITRDDEGTRGIRGWAWDLETNTKVTQEDEFRKLVQRKNKETRKTEWVTPDERDLRELTNRRAAILVRNCILQVLPKDLIEDAMGTARETIKHGAEKNPEETRKRLIMAFSELGVTPDMIEQKLGHPLAQCSPAEMADLRTIYKSIADGNSTWGEYVATDKNGEEPRRKSEGKAEPKVDAHVEPEVVTAEVLGDDLSPLPIDVSKPHILTEVRSLAKKGTFEIETKSGHKLFCADQRLYITATSAKQAGAHVLIDAKLDGNVLTLTGIEEMA